jgi:hypothetical protein
MGSVTSAYELKTVRVICQYLLKYQKKNYHKKSDGDLHDSSPRVEKVLFAYGVS